MLMAFSQNGFSIKLKNLRPKAERDAEDDDAALAITEMLKAAIYIIRLVERAQSHLILYKFAEDYQMLYSRQAKTLHRTVSSHISRLGILFDKKGITI